MTNIVETGFDDLDNILHGLTSPSLTVVASRPSMGKTSFALNIIEHVAIRQKVACAIFSSEESKEQIVRKLLCSCSQVKIQDFRTCTLTKGDWVRLKRAEKTISNAPIYTDDSPALTVLEIGAKMRRLQEKCHLGLVVIDYLQLLMADQKHPSRGAELSEISRALKGLALEFCIPLIVLCQLGRRPEYRKDKRPKLSDLHDLGSVGQDADTVLFVYRNWLYHFDSKDENKIEVIVGKNKNGSTGNVQLTFNGKTTRISNMKN